MRVTVVASRAEPDAGYVGERLEETGARMERVWRDDPGTLRNAADGSDLVVLLGSPRSVADPDNAASVAAETALVLGSHRAGRPVMGICYGGQLIAAAFGAPVRTLAVPEVGWVQVETGDPALAPAGPWFEFHEDAWGPAGPAQPPARTAAGPQAVIVGRTVGWQFHPEVSTAMLRGWFDRYPGMLERAALDREALLEESERRATDARRRCHALVDAFLAAAEGPAGGSPESGGWG